MGTRKTSAVDRLNAVIVLREHKDVIVERDGTMMSGTIREIVPLQVAERIGARSFSYTHEGAKFNCRLDGKQFIIEKPPEAKADLTAILRAVDKLRTCMKVFDVETTMEIVSKYAKMHHDQLNELRRNADYEVVEAHPVDLTKLPLKERATCEVMLEVSREARRKNPNSGVISEKRVITKKMVDAKIAQLKLESTKAEVE